VYPHPFMARYSACNARPTVALRWPRLRVASPGQRGKIQRSGGPYQYWAEFIRRANSLKDALEAYQRGFATAQQMLKHNPTPPAQRLLWGKCELGRQPLVQLKNIEAIRVFAQAANGRVSAIAVFNLCASLYNLEAQSDRWQHATTAISV